MSVKIQLVPLVFKGFVTRIVLAFLLVVLVGNVFAQSDSLKSYTTQMIVGEPPHIDGSMDDPAWQQVAWSTDPFTQLEPEAGKPASVHTQFKVVYDAKNIYFLILNHDPEPDKIVKRMSRRDGFEGDFVEVNIDSYYDKRTAFSFTSSVSGVKGDEYVSDNGNNWDSSWDPIWYMSTSVVKEGWIAEFRIPLSQLRFADKPEHTWGLQITRRFFRKQERSNWQYIPPDAGGWVHLFGHLNGIKGIRPQKQLEIQPYVVAKTERFEKEEGNPFVTGKSSSVDVGLDAKIGITSDITLDLTVNPDFGQVEADPSQVNLSAYRLYFQERRPFFIEGSNVLNFPITDFNNNNLFYSRRIGRTPQGWVETDQDEDDGVDEHVKQPTNTTILGAAKITGKNKNGFSWGVLESVTDAEYAKVDSLGHQHHVRVEPLTNYVVARAQQDINKGNTLVGGMITATHRDIKDDHLNWLHKSAYSAGADFLHHWDNRTYYVGLKTVVSHVKGDPASVTNTQLASERYFQRPDNNHAQLDSTRTSLTGTGGTAVFGKKAGKIVFDIGYTWMSPELELNDVGFLAITDVMSQWIWMQYRKLTPVRNFRWMRYNFIQYQDWDFDGRSLSRGYEVNGVVQMKNYWRLNAGIAATSHNVSNGDLRGGPAFYYPGDMNTWLTIVTDERKKLSFSVNPRWRKGGHGYMEGFDLNLGLFYRPVNALSLSLQPSIGTNQNELQYVTTFTDANGSDKYLVGYIDQQTVRVSLRATYMVTPNLSIQYWGQPFGTSGTYSRYKFINQANANEYADRFSEIPENQITQVDDVYHIDENLDGTTDYTFDKPDFNFAQFRSNLVLRWEYIPGSTVFLVWTQEMNGEFYNRSGGMSDKYDFNFASQPHNIFLVKYTYRFIL